MKKKTLLFTILLFIFMGSLTGCDPIYPLEDLEITKIDTLVVGESVEIEIIYPNTEGTVVLDWKDPSIEILKGGDIISVSDLSITGLKSGTALIKVSATTSISKVDARLGCEERTYFTEVEIKVE